MGAFICVLFLSNTTTDVLLLLVQTLVQEAIEGALLSHPSLARLQFDEGIKVLLRRDWDAKTSNKVSVGGIITSCAH